MKFAKAAFLAAISLLSPSTMGFTASSSAARRSAAAAFRRHHQFSISRSSSVLAANLLTASAFSANNNNCIAPPTLSVRGGTITSSSSALHSTVAEETEEATTASSPKEIFRSDYKPLPYKVSNVSMNFNIRDGNTIVETELTVVPNSLDGGKCVVRLVSSLCQNNICNHLIF